MKCTCQRDSACSSCPPSAVEQQEELVRQLQTYLIGRIGNTPSGQFKDYALALGIAVDKLIQLRAKPTVTWPRQFYQTNQITGQARPKPESI